MSVNFNEEDNTTVVPTAPAAEEVVAQTEETTPVAEATPVSEETSVEEKPQA